MKIKNLAFFGIMAAILGVNGAARADSTTIIASQAYVDAKDALKQNNLGGGTNAGKVVEATATAGTVNYRGIDTTPTASSSNLITSGGVQAAIAAVDLSSAVSQTITDGVTNKAPSEDAVHDAINVAENGEYIRAGTNVGTNLTALDNQVKANTSDIDTNATNIGTINTTIGNTAMGTTATTLTGAIAELNTGKQDSLTFDNSPTSGSDNPVKSGGVYTALSGKQDTLTFDDSPTSGSNNPVKSGGVYTAVDAKQNKLGGTGNGDKAVIASETEGTVTYKAIDTQVTANSDNLITSGAVSTAIGNASSAVNSAYDNNALDTAGLAAANNLAKMKAVQATIARQGSLGKAWSDEFSSADATTANATNLYAASKNSNEGRDMDNYVPTVKAVEQRLAGATTNDLKKLHDVTATAAELNILDGVTADASELNILDGATLTTTELNYVDGVTSSIQTQLDDKVAKNDAITGATHTKITYDSKGLVTGGSDIALSDVTDVTATADEVNKLAGLATTATELGYVSGVTSAIQTQLDNKVAKNNNITPSSANSIVQYDAKGLVTSGTAAGALATKDKITYSTDTDWKLSNVDVTGQADTAYTKCTKKSPCTLTFVYDNNTPIYEWTNMDTEDTDALL